MQPSPSDDGFNVENAMSGNSDMFLMMIFIANILQFLLKIFEILKDSNCIYQSSTGSKIIIGEHDETADIIKALVKTRSDRNKETLIEIKKSQDDEGGD